MNDELDRPLRIRYNTTREDPVVKRLSRVSGMDGSSSVRIFAAGGYEPQRNGTMLMSSAVSRAGGRRRGIFPRGISARGTVRIRTEDEWERKGVTKGNDFERMKRGGDIMLKQMACSDGLTSIAAIVCDEQETSMVRQLKTPLSPTDKKEFEQA